jgi:hypothetical protein
MDANVEELALDFHLNYKQLKDPRKEWISSPLYYSSNRTTAWRLQIDTSHPKKLGVYVSLVNGAPCALQSYRIYMLTKTNPPLKIFQNRCTVRRLFHSDDFSWGFENFCTRRDLKEERHLICEPKTKFVHVRCTMKLEIIPNDDPNDDHRLATDFFLTRSLGEWIELLNQRNDLPELNNRVNEELELRM